MQKLQKAKITVIYSQDNITQSAYLSFADSSHITHSPITFQEGLVENDLDSA